MAKRTPRPVKPDAETDSVKLLVQVPRASMPDVITLDWDSVLALAREEGWEMRETEKFSWCAKGHALLREGRDELRGIPCTLFQNW